MNLSHLLLLFRKVSRTFFLLFCLLTSAVLYSQKNAPIAGDASELVKLLKKDYSLIDPSIRNDEILKDRAFVILTFRAYLAEEEVQKSTFVVSLKNNEDQLVAYKKQQLILSTFSNKTEKLEKFDTISFRQMIERSDLAKKKYYDTLYKNDTLIMHSLKIAYSVKNVHAEYVLDLFIKKYKAIQTNGYDKLAKSNPNASIQKGVPFIGGDMGFDVMIEGLSKFLAKRIKEELTTYVIERVKEALNNPGPGDPLAELKVLLPRTNTYLLNFNASQVTSFPDEIKQYIEDDFNHILENIGGLRNTPRIRQLINKYPEVDLTLEALELIPTLSKIKNPVDYFEILENSRFVNRWADLANKNDILFNIGNTLKLSSMLAHSLTMVENGETRFVSTDFLNTYGTDPHFYLLYTGFLCQQNEKYYDIQFAIKTKEKVALKVSDEKGYKTDPATEFRIPFKAGMCELMSNFDGEKIESLNKEIRFFSKTLYSIGEHAEKVYLTALEIKKSNKAGKKIGADTIQSFVTSLIDLSEEVIISSDSLINYLVSKLGRVSLISYNLKEYEGVEFGDSDIKIERLNLTDKSAPYFRIARKTNDIVYDLQKKDYAVALIKALELTIDLLPEKIPSLQLLDTILTCFTDETKLKSWHPEDWSHVVLQIINKKEKVRDSDITSAEFVYKELKAMLRYCDTYYKSSKDLPIELTKFSGLVHAIIDGKKLNISQADSDLVTKLIGNLEFRNLILTYYTNLQVDKLGGRLEKELLNFTIDINNKPERLFTDTEAKELKDSFESYADVLMHYLIKNNKSNRKAFDEAKDEFKRFLTRLLLNAPEKFAFHLNENTLKLIHFVNDMAVSENSDDVADAIEAFALPAGSYAIKRTVMRNISINAYPGLIAAGDITWKNKTAYVGFSPSFTAPVGINLSFSGRKGNSHSIFMSIIDIGAFTRMYLTKNPIEKDSSTVSTLPDFKFQTIFSPGLYYSLGFKKTPLSLNIGLQYGPGLKAVLSNGETKVYESLRFGVGLVLDIPLLNLHTRLKPLER